MTQFTQEQKEILWVAGVLHQLCEWGLMKGPELLAPGRGISEWDQVDAEGCYLTDAELASAVKLLTKDSYDDRMVLLCMSFRDDRQKMEKWVEENRGKRGN